MGKRIAVVASALSLLLIGQPCFAQRVGEMRGAGGYSCGEFIESRGKTGADLFYAQWTMGFVSSYNLFSAHAQVRVPEASAILLHAEKYCRDNPLGTYAQAAFSLLGELGGWQPPNASKK